MGQFDSPVGEELTVCSALSTMVTLTATACNTETVWLVSAMRNSIPTKRSPLGAGGS